VSFIRHEKIYRHDVQGEAEHESNFPIDHRCDESSAGYSFVGCSPAVPTSASRAANSFSLYTLLLSISVANRNCPSNTLSQPRGPLQPGLRDLFALSVEGNRVVQAAPHYPRGEVGAR
jgi:hypothetical protein